MLMLSRLQAGRTSRTADVVLLAAIQRPGMYAMPGPYTVEAAVSRRRRRQRHMAASNKNPSAFQFAKAATYS